MTKLDPEQCHSDSHRLEHRVDVSEDEASTEEPGYGDVYSATQDGSIQPAPAGGLSNNWSNNWSVPRNRRRSGQDGEEKVKPMIVKDSACNDTYLAPQESCIEEDAATSTSSLLTNKPKSNNCQKSLQNESVCNRNQRKIEKDEEDDSKQPMSMEVDLSDCKMDLKVKGSPRSSILGGDADDDSSVPEKMWNRDLSDESDSQRSSMLVEDLIAKKKWEEMGIKEPEVSHSAGGCRTWLGLTLLLFANTLNYMDRYTIAGVLLDVQDYYQIDNAAAGLLQTSFIISYMLFSPLFGFLGDRFNRKIIMAVGISLWSAITLVSSFVPAHMFPLFLFTRALVGIGEASYSTIAPTIIADLFVGDRRTKALSFFYFAIPVGSGLGYIVGSKVAQYMHHWQWALRVTPVLGILCVVLIMLVVKEPERGAAEGGHQQVTSVSCKSYIEDLRYLVHNKSFILSSLGFTCVAFVAGALALWAPAYMDYSIRAQGHQDPESTVSLIFGVITCSAGFLGVAIGSESARRLRRYSSCADPLVCAFGLIACSPFLFTVLVLSKYNTIASWVLVFVGETFLCLNWAIVTDILLYIVVPNRRSTAEAFQILLSHLLGDAGSPYMIGAISDAVAGNSNSVGRTYVGLHYALYSSCFVAVLGGGFFLATALFLKDDRQKAQLQIKGNNSLGESSSEGSSTSSSNSDLSAQTATTYPDGSTQQIDKTAVQV